MQHLLYLNKYFLKYHRRLLAGTIFIFISNYFQSLQPQMIRQALDMVVQNVAVYHLFNGYGNQSEVLTLLMSTLFYFGIIVLILALLMGFFLFLVRQTIIVMSRLVEYDLRKEIFAHYEALHIGFYKKNKIGDMMARIVEDVSKVRMYLGPAILYGLNLISLFLLVVYSMIKVSWELTLYSLAPLPLLSLSIYYVSNLIHRYSENIQYRLSGLSSIAQEAYSGIRVLKSYVQEAATGRYFQSESQDYMNQSLRLARVDAMFHPLVMILIGTSTLIVVYAGGIQVARGQITPGNIAEFIIYINMLSWPVTSLGWISSLIQQASASQKRINEFLSIQPEILNPADSFGNGLPDNQKPNTKRHSERLKGAIEFDKVSFTYPDTGIRALQDVSFRLEPGQRLAITGRTGSGKTTIADLIVRLYDVTEGVVRIDGVDIRKTDVGRIRRRVGYVTQDVFLFSDTVSNNIRFGSPGASQEEIELFARYAAIHQEIEELPNGYDTLVGERGVTLSGGQKQRISIARALIKDPDILIFDDCLSAVDTDTEKQILNNLSKRIAGKTTIIITHRIFSLLDFDKIIVLDNGRIIEEGTHAELLQKKGYYYEQFEKQRAEIKA